MLYRQALYVKGCDFMEFKKVTFLKVYTGEDLILNDKPFYKAVIEEAMRLKLAGGTVSRGIGGYASEKRGIDQKIGSFFTSLPNMPVVVEIIDTRENIEKILPWLEKHATKSLVLVEESTCLVTDYMRQEEAKKAVQA